MHDIWHHEIDCRTLSHLRNNRMFTTYPMPTTVCFPRIQCQQPYVYHVWLQFCSAQVAQAMWHERVWMSIRTWASSPSLRLVRVRGSERNTVCVRVQTWDSLHAIPLQTVAHSQYGWTNATHLVGLSSPDISCFIRLLWPLGTTIHTRQDNDNVLRTVAKRLWNRPGASPKTYTKLQPVSYTHLTLPTILLV